MSKAENLAHEQVKFLVSCIKHANNGKPNFEAVAQELEIVSKAAAFFYSQKRYERLLKAHAVNGAKAASKDSDETDSVLTPQSTPVKRKNARGTPSSAAKKPKVKAAKKEEDAEPEPEPEVEAKEEQDDEPVKKETKEEADLSDPPSDGDAEI
ncbi:ATPase-like, ATP-binding domain protein [Purpureocillium lavendulum]|uniref:ATPase-like, ATP-binding domain protein n=1 Tax=Purpureocillium lavendulum TaxID=1247861 RepID=A0AB34FSQ5_9HYPO|nr:ATPase-like, ATP-binding domain protein [Purpureocillium lavendulum]